jgi:hypothetical protein
VSCQLFCFTRLRAGDARHAFEPRQLPSKPCRPRWTPLEYHPARYRAHGNKNGAGLVTEDRAVITLQPSSCRVSAGADYFFTVAAAAPAGGMHASEGEVKMLSLP